MTGRIEDPKGIERCSLRAETCRLAQRWLTVAYAALVIGGAAYFKGGWGTVGADTLAITSILMAQRMSAVARSHERVLRTFWQESGEQTWD